MVVFCAMPIVSDANNSQKYILYNYDLIDKSSYIFVLNGISNNQGGANQITDHKVQISRNLKGSIDKDYMIRAVKVEKKESPFDYINLIESNPDYWLKSSITGKAIRNAHDAEPYFVYYDSPDLEYLVFLDSKKEILSFFPVTLDSPITRVVQKRLSSDNSLEDEPLSPVDIFKKPKYYQDRIVTLRGFIEITEEPEVFGRIYESKKDLVNKNINNSVLIKNQAFKYHYKSGEPFLDKGEIKRCAECNDLNSFIFWPFTYKGNSTPPRLTRKKIEGNM